MSLLYGTWNFTSLLAFVHVGSFYLQALSARSTEL